MIVYAIPGLGTTEKLYENLRFKNATLKVLDWPVPEINDTMQSYAKKFLPQIDITQPFYLCGVSFGGMLSSELSKIISPQKTFLISTCKNRSELPWFIRLLKHVPLHLKVNEAKHRQMAYHGRWVVGFGKAYIPEFLGMVNEMKGNYFKHCINIITKWDAINLPVNAIHIHGTNDKLLTHKNVKADYLIKDGSHAMVVFRAEEVAEIINKYIS
jgi:esterase/lipase